MQIEQQKAIQFIDQRIHVINRNSQAFLNAVEQFTSEPAEKHLTTIIHHFQEINLNIAEIAPKAELFQSQAIFSNIPGATFLEPMRSDKLGKFEHAITEQIQKIDDKLTSNMSYGKYNRILSHRISYFNGVINGCLKNMIDKL